jgi:hypothetical protein
MALRRPQSQATRRHLERAAASRVFSPLDPLQPILRGGAARGLSPFGAPPPAAAEVAAGSGWGGGLGGRWRVGLELSEGVLAFRALKDSPFPGERGGGDPERGHLPPDQRGWSPVLHADVPRCHAKRNTRLGDCMLLGVPGAVRSGI